MADGVDESVIEQIANSPNNKEIIKFLVHLESQIQARDLLIQHLRLEKLRPLLYAKKYGFWYLTDPVRALSRDSNLLDENLEPIEIGVANQANCHIQHLDRLIALHNEAQTKSTAQQMKLQEELDKVKRELEIEKKKHHKDRAQGDDVTVGLEKDRERWQVEAENQMEKANKLATENAKLQQMTVQQNNLIAKQKQVALLLLKERSKLFDKMDELKSDSSSQASSSSSQLDTLGTSNSFSAVTNTSQQQLEIKSLRNKLEEALSAKVEMSDEVKRLQIQVSILQNQLLAATSGPPSPGGPSSMISGSFPSGVGMYGLPIGANAHGDAGPNASPISIKLASRTVSLSLPGKIPTTTQSSSLFSSPQSTMIRRQVTSATASNSASVTTPPKPQYSLDFSSPDPPQSIERALAQLTGSSLRSTPPPPGPPVAFSASSPFRSTSVTSNNAGGAIGDPASLKAGSLTASVSTSGRSVPLLPGSTTSFTTASGSRVRLHMSGPPGGPPTAPTPPPTIFSAENSSSPSAKSFSPSVVPHIPLQHPVPSRPGGGGTLTPPHSATSSSTSIPLIRPPPRAPLK